MDALIISYVEFLILFYMFHNFFITIAIEAMIPYPSLLLITLCLIHTSIGTLLMYYVPFVLYGSYKDLCTLIVVGVGVAVLWQIMWLWLSSVSLMWKRLIILCTMPCITGVVAYFFQIFLHWYARQ